jgi:chitodextrinase
MSVRSTLFVASALVLALAFGSAAPAKRPPSPTPADRSAPTAPTNLRITASSATSISLAWNPSTDNSANWWYCVQVDGAGCYRVNPPQTTFTHPKLAPDRTTMWTVVALDAAGNRSGSSNGVVFTTPPDVTAPSPAPTLTATAVYPTRISLSWTESADNTSQVWYTLLADGTPYFSDLIGSRATTVLYLSPSTTYGFKISARDAYGNTTQSNLLSVTTPPTTDTVAPTAPTNLRFSFQTSPPEAWLNWDQSTDDTDPQSQILYEVYVNGTRADESTTIGYSSTIAYCRAEGPTTFVARAFDTSGNMSPPSNELVLTC